MEKKKNMIGSEPGSGDEPQPITHLRGAGVGYQQTFVEDPRMPDFVIDGLFPEAAFAINAGGGTLKTTTMIRIMINVVLGLPVFEREVIKEGPCVLVTKEDNIQVCRYRVRKMCDAMGLTDLQRKKVAKRLIIEDLVGKPLRLVEMNSDNNIEHGRLVSEFCEFYQHEGLAITTFDPMSHFGAGERFVNDSEAEAMNALAAIADELKCAAGVLHHTGKSVYRDATIDMYAGRGGSALADNARMVGVMAAHGQLDPKQISFAEERYPLPAELLNELRFDLTARSRMIRLHFEKESFCKKPDQPVWILRDKHDHWRFDDYWGEYASKEDREARKKAQKDESNMEDFAHIRNFIVETQSLPGDEQTIITKRSVRDHFNDFGQISRARAENIVAWAMQPEIGLLREKSLPKEKRQGRRTHELVLETRSYGDEEKRA